MLTIENATANDIDLWQSYILSKNVTHYAYDWRWRAIIKNVFRHEPHYLIAKDNNEICGILPLFYVKSLLFGKALISIPYMNGGGALCRDEESFNGLISEARKLGDSLDVKYLELRNRELLIPNYEALNLNHRSHKVAMILDLKKDPEELFASFTPKLRSQIRRPTKESCVAESARGNDISDKQIADFYTVFADNMKTLGTPVYPLRFFRETIRSFGDRSRLTLVRLNGAPIAGGITIGTGTSVEIPWAASLRKHSKFAPNMLLYWETIKNCCLDGYDHFDFGRSSSNSGTFKFKSQWGAKPLPLNWYYLVRKGDVPNVNPENDTFSLAVKIWKKLPMPITKILGSYITRSLP